MANIYDIAKIKSGDPLGRASESAREAGTLLEQFRHQKDIIDEINKAIADAKKKSKKDRGLFSGAGSLLGGLLSAAIPGGPLVSALLSGAGAGIGEKFRQDKLDITADLEKAKEVLKNRRQESKIGETITGIEQGLDEQVMGTAKTAALMSMIFPKTLGEEGASTTYGWNQDMMGGDFLSGLDLGKLDATDLTNFIDSSHGQALLGTLHYGAAPFLDTISGELELGEYDEPEWQNPYAFTRGGYRG